MNQILNFCENYGGRVESIREFARYQMKALGLEGQRVTVVFREYDPVYDGEFRGGWHDFGPSGSFVLLEVWDKEHQPIEALKWMICHELRHAFQTHYHVEFVEETRGMVSYSEYRANHDILPEERDADKWADFVTNYDGEKWWKEIEAHNKKTLQTVRG